MTEKQAAQEERLAKLEASASQDVGEPLAPKVDQMAKDLHDLHKAVDAVKAAASKAAGEAAAALGAAGEQSTPVTGHR